MLGGELLPEHCYGKLLVIVKTNGTPAILSRDFVAQLYRVTKLQYATVHVAHCDFLV